MNSVNSQWLLRRQCRQSLFNTPEQSVSVYFLFIFLFFVCVFFNVSVALSFYSGGCSFLKYKLEKPKWIMLKFMFKGNMPLDKGDLGHVRASHLCFRPWFPSRSQVSLPLPTSYIIQWHPLLAKAWLISSLSKAITRTKQFNLTHSRKKTALFMF